MDKIFAFLNSIPVDRYQHFITGTLLFAIVYHWSTALVAFLVSSGFHVAKKIVNYVQGERDYSDLWQDVAYGVGGALLGWACILPK